MDIVLKPKKIVPLFCKECDVVEYKEQKTLKSRTNRQAKREKKKKDLV